MEQHVIRNDEYTSIEVRADMDVLWLSKTSGINTYGELRITKEAALELAQYILDNYSQPKQ